MDWIRSFYEKQHRWANVCAGNVRTHHREKAKSVVLPESAGPYRILELGCGGGQMAAALADLRHSVVAIDMNPDAIHHARQLADTRPDARITLIEGDFYAFSTEKPFDLVCYFDGFGIGTDADQQELLHRIASWLTEGGRAFIEVYTPWYWRRVAGTTVEWPDVSRCYGFDDTGCRMLDT